MHRGYIKLWRKIEESISYSRGVNHKAAMLHILIKANHKPGYFMGVSIPSGSFACGIQSLGNEIGLTYQQTRDTLQSLTEDKFIEVKGTSKFSIVTVLNWAVYQGDAANVERANNEQGTSGERTENEQGTSGERQSENERMKECKKEQPVRQRTVFVPPTLEEVVEHCKNHTTIDPVAFHAHYTTNGWRQSSGLAIKNWKACIVTWEKNRKNQQAQLTGPGGVVL